MRQVGVGPVIPVRQVGTGPVLPAVQSVPAPSNPPSQGDYVALVPGNTAANPYYYTGLLMNFRGPGAITWMGNFQPSGAWVDFGAGATAGWIAGMRPGIGDQALTVTNSAGAKAGVTVGQLFVQPPASVPAISAGPAPVQSVAQQAAPAPALVTAQAPANTAATDTTTPQPAMPVMTPAPVVEYDTDSDQSDTGPAAQVAVPDNSGLLWLLLAAGVVLLIA